LFEFNGILFFPITPYDSSGAVDIAVFSEHVGQRLDEGARAVFAACGTGEFAALNDDEAAAVVAEAVKRSHGRVPVFVGAGTGVGPARRRIDRAAAAGADGVLLFAPECADAGQAGLVSYVQSIAELSPLPIIVYQKGAMRLSTESAARIAQIPNVVGLKDGLGDIERVRRQVAAITEVRPDFLFVNGLPTAELTMAAYRAVGVQHYSSAVFAFAPDIALSFYQALASQDTKKQQHLIDGFFAPFADIRSMRSDYAVSLVKAGVGLSGLKVGDPRPPLAVPAPAHVDSLRSLVERQRR
jgi:5-dehydro-4-deoxyglucarate dehydratase